MTTAEADALIATLPKPGGLQLYRKGDEIIMDGGQWGGHSISAKASSGARLLIHWKGYVENNGKSLGSGYTPAAAVPTSNVPAVGEWVSFPSKSAASGRRRGQVLKVTGKRVLIAYRFDYEREVDRRQGLKFDPATAHTKWCKLTEIQRK